jgi:tetratricopeptide (TPR) repeat protein
MLIIRSQTDRLPVDFGRTNTWHRLWDHISDAKDKEFHFQGIFDYLDLFFFLKIQYRNLTSPLIWLSLPFVCWGLRFLWVRFQILSVALVLLILTNCVFFYYWIDGSSAFLPSILAFFLLLSLGLGQFGRALKKRVQKHRWIKFLPTVIFLSGFIVLGPLRFSERPSQSGFNSTEIYWSDFTKLPPESLLLSSTSWFIFTAFQNVYSVRPDVNLILTSGLAGPQFFVYPEPQKMPLVIFPKNSDGSFLDPFDSKFTNFFININIENGKRAFTQYDQEFSVLFPYVRPDKNFLWFGEIVQDHRAGYFAVNDGSYEQHLKRLLSYYKNIIHQNELKFSPKAIPYFFEMTDSLTNYFFDLQRYDISYNYIREFIKIFSKPDGQFTLPFGIFLNAYAILVNSARFLELYDVAEQNAKIMLKFHPNQPNTWYILGNIYLSLNRGILALEALKKAVDLSPFETGFIYRYGQALAKYSSINDAIQFYNDRISLFKKNGLLNQISFLLSQKECLLLPPEKIDLLDISPSGDILSYNQGIQQ